MQQSGAVALSVQFNPTASKQVLGEAGPALQPFGFCEHTYLIRLSPPSAAQQYGLAGVAPWHAASLNSTSPVKGFTVHSSTKVGLNEVEGAKLG